MSAGRARWVGPAPAFAAVLAVAALASSLWGDDALPRLGTQVIRLQEAWGLTHPHAFSVQPSGAVLPDGEISQFLHGVRNHPELHSPIRLVVRYPIAGRFIVHVFETSGYGGAELRIYLDGALRLHREFPGQANTVLRDYAGDYALDVPAGRHEVVLDNQAADWTRIAELRLTSYCPWRLETEKATGRVVLRLYDDRGRPLDGAAARAMTVGRTWPLTGRGGGVYVSPPLASLLERGDYPVHVWATWRGRELLRTQVKVEVRHRRLLLRRAAFTAGRPLSLLVAYFDADGKPIGGADVSVAFAGRVVRLRPSDRPGFYAARADPLPPGRYPAVLRARSPAHEERAWLISYTPGSKLAGARGIVRLRPDGWFALADGRPFTPYGFASIHVFQPTLDAPTIEGWLESSWNLADEAKVADWLALLSTQGVNVIRIGLTVKSDGVPGDMGGYVQPQFLARFRRFLDTCGALGLRALPVLYWGHWTTFGLENVPAYNPLMSAWSDWYTKPEAIRLQQAFTRQMVAPFASDPRIFAWEPMNEIRPEIGGQPEVPIAWTNRICQAIREVDRSHLITISPLVTQPYYHIRYARESAADFINYHFYADYTSPRRGIADLVAVCTRLNQTGGKPAIVGEAGTTGGPLGCLYPDAVRRATRDIYWASVLTGAPGCIGWDGNTTSPAETRMLGEVLTATGWYGRRPDRASVAVTYRDTRADVWPLTAAEGALADRGVWHDLVAADDPTLARYRYRLTPTEAKSQAARLPRLVEATRPYAALARVADGGRWALIYLRNEGAFDGGGGRWATPTNLRAVVALPGRHRLVVWDLETRRKVAGMAFRDRGAFAAAGTRSDYALWVTTPAGGKR